MKRRHCSDLTFAALIDPNDLPGRIDSRGLTQRDLTHEGELNLHQRMELNMKSTPSIAGKVLHILAALMLMGSGAAMAATTIATVPVGNAGNLGDSVIAYGGAVANDLTTGLGAVNYNYSIGKYEVTAGQYTDFLNAVAQTDTYGLYRPAMANTAFSGITRLGSSNSYSYVVADPNRPVNGVSFWSAVRFANWLSNGQPPGLQGPGTTETGSYTLTPASIANNTVTRNFSATWVIPTESEWYKAAYYNAGLSNYWAYPTQNNTLPSNTVGSFSIPSANAPNTANLEGSGPYPGPIEPGSPGHYTTTVGLFANSPGPYGTFDQGGNVYEWNEALTPNSLGQGTGRGLRGGSFGDNLASSADRTNLLGVPPGYDAYVAGFRVAVVPEPGTYALLASGLAVVSALARRRREARDQ